MALELALPAGQFSIILADPPWNYADKGCNGAAELHYETMKLEDIIKLPIRSIAADDCALFIWGTYPKLPDVLATIAAWGFEYKSIAFQWVKTRGKHADGSGKEFMGLGRWTRGNTEPCFLAVRGRPHRVDKGVRQLIWTALADEELVVAEVGAHSAKPPEVRERIVRLMGDLPRIELFARDACAGWDCWGHEAPKSIGIDLSACFKCGETMEFRHECKDMTVDTVPSDLTIGDYYALADGRLVTFDGVAARYSFFVGSLDGATCKFKLETASAQAWPCGDAGVQCSACKWLIAGVAAEGADRCPFCGTGEAAL